MSDTGSSHHAPASDIGGTAPPGPLSDVKPLPTPDDATVITSRAVKPGSSPGRPVSPFDLGKLLAGEQLDHFQLLEYVGGGGMGAVFRARDTMLGREVALKVLSRDQGADDETRRRFQNEAQSAARLDHENIARVYYVGEDRGLNYIVFEFIEGVNMRDLVEQRGGPLPLAEAISYTLQIARALDHASSRDVVHRDIKPSNILIAAQGRAKLVDMGLARLHQVDASRQDLTASGVTLGTFDYISPEQARDPRSADVRSDIYSLGCTLYYMVTARPPFPEGTVLQKLLQHNSDEPADPRDFNPELPEEFSRLLTRMLAKNPRRRFQTPGELIAELLQLADQVGLSTTMWGLPVTVPQPASQVSFFERHLPWVVPVAVLLLAVLLLDVMSRSPATTDELARTPDASVEQPRVPPAASTAPTVPHEPDDGKVDTAPKAADKTIVMPVETAVSIPASESRASTADSERPATDGKTISSILSAANTSESAGSAAAPLALAHPPADSEPLRPGLLVVSPTMQGPQRYASLRAACSEAKNGDVIELRYNGRREERPIDLNNLRFTIRSGEGFQPVVVFRPDEIDPLRYPRSMITVAGGRLTLLGLAIELELPTPQDVPADSWSMFATQRCESLDLQDCSLTIRNRTEQVNFFHLEAAPGADAMLASDEAMPDEPVAIHLENCVVRGAASIVRVSDLEPLNLSWENGLAITSERFLVVTGGQVAPRHGHHVRLSLQHLTAFVGSGLCLLTNSFDAPYLRDTEISASDSILLATSGAPFVEQEGVDGVATFQRQFAYNGDRNFYEGFDGDAFWRILDQNDPDESQQLSFLEWISHWGQQHEFLPNWGEVAWKKLPPSDRPLHLRTADDYALSTETSGNMARDGASDGRDVGMTATLLPRLPAENSPPLPTAAANR